MVGDGACFAAELITEDGTKTTQRTKQRLLDSVLRKEKTKIEQKTS